MILLVTLIFFSTRQHGHVGAGAEERFRDQHYGLGRLCYSPGHHIRENGRTRKATSRLFRVSVRGDDVDNALGDLVNSH